MFQPPTLSFSESTEGPRSLDSLRSAPGLRCKADRLGAKLQIAAYDRGDLAPSPYITPPHGLYMRASRFSGPFRDFRDKYWAACRRSRGNQRVRNVLLHDRS
ncbi:hypothetical protein VTO73DRAFT_11241 [Trametes versicolor]